MAEKDQVFRFAVGEVAGLRSAIYRLWTPSQSLGKEDVYFGMSGVAGFAKISLHTNRGHLGLTREAADAASLQSRFVHVWQRDRGFIASGELALEVIIPTSELQLEPLVNEDASDPRIHWLAAAPQGMAQTIGVILCAPNRADTIASTLGSQLFLLARFELGSGDVCLALAGVRPMSSDLVTAVEQRKDAARRGETPVIGANSALTPGSRTILGFRRDPQVTGWIETNLRNDSRSRE